VLGPVVVSTGLRGAAPALGVVLEEDAVDDLLDDAQLVVVETVEGFQAEAKALALGAALVGVEEQGVAGYAEAASELAQDLQGGLGLVGLVWPGCASTTSTASEAR
jgi:hypothetical protein